jgi:insulysin
MKTKAFLIPLASCSILLASLSADAVKDDCVGCEVIEDKAQIPLLNPSLSQRTVRKLVLSNGLQAYLISDPGAEQSAAGLSVEAGSWQDPVEYPGMAHFLEHMLFMGTSAYPEEFGYMQYINDNGGHVNASTWPDRTIYMFSVNNEAYSGALDRFSHFFIDPLFSPSCIGRELHAVDQEHAKNIENDNWREYMIFKETGNPNHPNAAFSTGNAQTLSGIPQKALVEWYQSNYSANRMHLVMVSPLPMDELMTLAMADFSRVPNYNLEKGARLPQLSSMHQKGHMIFIKPIKDLRQLSLEWEVPSEFADNLEKMAPEIVAAILNNGSSTSLLEQLKREKIAESLNVSTDRYNKDQVLFKIDINLTQQGISQIDTAILRCFQAIAQLKETGVPAYLFDEIRKMSTINYQYQSREDAFGSISKHAHDLIDEDLETYPEKLSIPTIYAPEFISQFINTLTAQSCMFFIQADPKMTGVLPDRKEKWMDAEYAIKEVPETTLAAFQNAEPNPNIDLPGKNPFIPSHLALLPSSEDSSSEPNPVLLAKDEGSKVYYAQDSRYLVPEVSVIFGIKSPQIDGSAKSAALADLYLKALTEKLSPTLYLAQVAGLSPSFSQQDLKLNISIQGYSEKAPILVKEIFQSLKQVMPTREQFEIYREWLLTNYDNASKELPVKQGMELLGSIIYNDAPANTEKYKALKTISYEDFVKFSAGLPKKTYIEALLYGNLLEKDAQTLWLAVKKILGTSPYPIDKQIKKNVLVLPEKDGPYMVISKTERQGNGVVLLLEEGKFSFSKRAAQQVLSKALQEAFFDTLRTKQQTAYFAKAWDSEIERELFQFFAVQSSTHHPRDLIARFELFLEDFVKNISEKIPEERFLTIQKMLVTTLQMPPENLEGMAFRLNVLAFNYAGDFKWYEKRINSVKDLTYEQIVQAAGAFLSRENSKRIAVLVEGVLSPDNDFQYQVMTKQDICDAGTYVTWR